MDQRDELHVRQLVLEVRRMLAIILAMNAEIEHIKQEMLKFQDIYNTHVGLVDERLSNIEKLNDLSDKINDIYNYYHNNYDIVKKRERMFE